jgi:phage baseplate assembly protein V
MNLFDLIARGTVTAVNGKRRLRTLQLLLLDEDVREPIEHCEPYGFSSEVKTGSEVVAVSLGGDRDHTLALVVFDRRYRPTNMKSGEVCIYDDKERKIYLSEDGIIIDGASSPITVKTSGTVTIDAPTVKMTGNLQVGGNIVAAGNISDLNGSKSMAGMRSTYDSHTHNGGSTPDQKM